MSADLARLTAAQAKADAVVRAVGEPIDGGPRLRVAVTDVETGNRLATCFVSYQIVDQASGPNLRLVAS